MISRQLKSHLKSHTEKHGNVQKEYWLKARKGHPQVLGSCAAWTFMRNVHALTPTGPLNNRGIKKHLKHCIRQLDREAATDNSYLFSKKLHRSLCGQLKYVLRIKRGEVNASVSLYFLKSHEFGIILVINFTLLGFGV